MSDVKNSNKKVSKSSKLTSRFSHHVLEDLVYKNYKTKKVLKKFFIEIFSFYVIF